MAITKYARTVHTGSDPQRQPGQPEAAHGSPPHPAVMNPCLRIVAIMLEHSGQAFWGSLTSNYVLFCFVGEGRGGECLHWSAVRHSSLAALPEGLPLAS